jgi:DNA repair protein RadC
LSDSELLAIILRLGIKGASAIDLGREVLGHFGGFRRMADANLNEWRQIKGLGTARTEAGKDHGGFGGGLQVHASG